MSSRLSLGLGLSVLIAGSAAAAAQTTIVVPGGYGPLTPDQRAYVETYVVRHPVPPAPLPGGFVAAVGGVVPAGVELRRFGPAPAYGPYGGQYGYEPGYDAAGYDTAEDEAGYGAGPAPAYGGSYGAGYDLSGYRYIVMPGHEAAVVEPRSRRIILIIE